MTPEQEISEVRERIARKLRVVVSEYGEQVLESVGIVSSHEFLGSNVAGYPHYYCPNVGSEKIIVRTPVPITFSYKAASLFEDTI